MPTHAEKRVVPYSAEEMYALIADVGALPGVPALVRGGAGARHAAAARRATGEVMEADLVVSFKVYRERSAAG